MWGRAGGGGGHPDHVSGSGGGLLVGGGPEQLRLQPAQHPLVQLPPLLVQPEGTHPSSISRLTAASVSALTDDLHERRSSVDIRGTSAVCQGRYCRASLTRRQ